MSELERGVIGITVEKLIEIAEVMGVHPLTVLLDSFSSYEAVAPERLLQQIAHEHNEVGSYRSNENEAGEDLLDVDDWPVSQLPLEDETNDPW